MKAFKREDIEHPAARRLPPFASTDDSVEDQAAAWSDALRDGDAAPGLRDAFESWRAADPAHDRAFADVDRAYRIARAAGGSHALYAMEAEIMRRAAARRRRRQMLGGGAVSLAASVVLALTVVLAGGWSNLRHLPAHAFYALSGDSLHRTEVGDRRSVALDDGSRMILNTDSRAIVRYRDGVRGITLTRGQVLFEVARDTARPFVVTAGNRKVTALGTKFDVRMDGERLEVTLIEGRVSVEDDERPGPRAQGPARDEKRPAPGARRPSHVSRLTSHVLEPGQQLIALAAAEPIIRAADLQRATSWRNGQVIFENDPLTEAVAEINRYTHRRVVLADERLSGMRLSGAFNTNNTRVFVDMLTLHLPVTIVQATNDRIVLGYNGG